MSAEKLTQPLLSEPGLWPDAVTPDPLMFASGGEAHDDGYGRKECEYVVFIEYHHGRPFQVITETRSDHREWARRFPQHAGNVSRKTGVSESQFDFEWCKRDGMLYWSNSGGGPRDPIRVGVCINENLKRPDHSIWAAQGVKLALDGVEGQPTREDFRKVGIILLRKPKALTGAGEINPFKAGSGDEPTIYCPDCNDNFPREEGMPCKHIRWCEECNDFVRIADHKDVGGGKEKAAPIHCCDCGKKIGKKWHAKHGGLCSECDWPNSDMDADDQK